MPLFLSARPDRVFFFPRVRTASIFLRVPLLKPAPSGASTHSLQRGTSPSPCRGSKPGLIQKMPFPGPAAPSGCTSQMQRPSVRGASSLFFRDQEPVRQDFCQVAFCRCRPIPGVVVDFFFPGKVRFLVRRGLMFSHRRGLQTLVVSFFSYCRLLFPLWVAAGRR